MSLIDSSALYLYNALKKVGAFDMVLFLETSAKCCRCGDYLEAAYCGNRIYAVRCARGCNGVFLVDGNGHENAARTIAGSSRKDDERG